MDIGDRLAGQPSRTAAAAAAARAAHLLIDSEPWILEDPLAAPLLGDLGGELMAAHLDQATAEVLAVMRVAMTTRSRCAEDRLSQAVERGMRQCVLLGAGLDSFAYRSPLARRLAVFEVDQPATQSWKWQRLAAASIALPDQVRLVPVDFALDSLAGRLLDSGFDPAQPAFVSWLGVTQYLTLNSIGATLDVIGGFSPGTELIMEYLVPPEIRDGPGQALADYFMPRAAAIGEPWLTFLTPARADRMVEARGMVVKADLGRKDQVDPSLWERSDALTPHEMGRLIHAVLPA